MQIDHTCHNRGCVNPDHLRVVTIRQNSQNRAGANPNSKSGVRGVHWRQDAKKWQVTIRCADVIRHYGYFADLDEAAEVARVARLSLFTHSDTDRR